MRQSFVSVRSGVRPSALDHDLAAGVSPEATSQHAGRARHLVAPRTRRALAASWEHLLLTVHAPAGRLTGRAPMCRQRIQRAEPEIDALITALRASGPVPARGVAIATRLLRDGAGPIYNPRAADDLMTRLALAREHLDPARPLIDASPSDHVSPKRNR